MKKICTTSLGYLPSFLIGDLSPGRRRSVARHLEGCEECRKLLDLLTVNRQEFMRRMSSLVKEHPSTEVLVSFAVGHNALGLQMNAKDRMDMEMHLVLCPLCMILIRDVRRVERELGSR